MTSIGTVIDGKYEVLNEIGRGGMSVVYLAKDTHLNKLWAVKEVLKKGKGKNGEVVVNSLMAEANMMKRLDYPAFPRIVDIIDNGVTIYVVMDYIEGESLDKILNEYGAQPEEKVIEWAMQICDALSYLHRQKPPIIYRDMKPANVMLNTDGIIKIIDFGIAREYKEQNLADTTILGTKGYAPPEAYSGQTNPRSDIYALGMTMHHLLTGVDPRSGEAYAPVRQWNPELSDGIEAIINKCTQPAEEKRYQSCAELMFDLQHPELVTLGYRRKQKKKLGAFIAAAAMSVIALAAGFTCKTVASTMNNNTYDSLVNISESTDYETKIDKYKTAIQIYPNKMQAYLRMVDAFENEASFTKNNNDVFLALYNANRGSFDESSDEYAELNYRIGMLYFNYYTEEENVSSFSTRINKAYPFFSANHENPELSKDFEYATLSESYYQICSFYKNYILNKTTIEEASKEDCSNLLATIESGMKAVENENAYNRLTFYNGAFMLLSDMEMRNIFASVGLEEERVLSLFDQIYESTKSVSTQKNESLKLKNEILNNYQEKRDMIIAAYDNAQKGD